MAEENRKAIELGGLALSEVEEFSRIERDDRLLDIFPKETIEKGVQLWEKWTDEEVEIIRIHDSKNITKHIFARKKIEAALKENKVLMLM